MTSRLGNHLLRRLRRSLEAEALDRAVESDILIASARDVDGVQVCRYAAHPLMLERTPSQIEQLLARLGPRGTSSPPPAVSTGDEGIAGSFDQDFLWPSSSGPRLKRDVSAPVGQGYGGDANSRCLTARLLRDVRRSVDRPQAAEVATLLLLARAVTDSGVSLMEVLRALRTSRPIVTLVASVAGFEGSFTDLLTKGFVLPGKVAITSGYELSSASVRFSMHGSCRWRIVMFPGGKFDADDHEENDTRVDRAALTSYPILGVAEAIDLIPPRLREASFLTLCTGPLDSDLVEEVVHAVLGEASGVRLPDDSCSLLTLSDLALAIRPGGTPEHAVHVLRQIAATRGANLEAGSGKPRNKDSQRNEGSWSRTSKSGRGNPGSGSEIIQPTPVTDADNDRPVPRVESLTGYGEAADWAMSLKTDLELWRTGGLCWEDMSTRILLSGPPGTGKTLFARALCNTLQVPLIATSVATWLEPGYLGDVLKRMTAAFAEAESLRPAILFVDELDGIGTRRQQGDWAEYTNSIVNRGLELLDGATRSQGVIVVAATNHPSMIDPALLRSGRLEKHIEIQQPDTQAIVGILRHHLGNDLAGVVASAPPDIMEPAVSANPVAIVPDASAAVCPEAVNGTKATTGVSAIDAPTEAAAAATATRPATRSKAGKRDAAHLTPQEVTHGEV